MARDLSIVDIYKQWIASTVMLVLVDAEENPTIKAMGLMIETMKNMVDNGVSTKEIIDTYFSELDKNYGTFDE